jgi:short-subunit dehydrogenase
LSKTACEIEEMGREAIAVPADVSDPAQVKVLLDETLSRWGRVDILIANAGTYTRKPVADLSAADVEQSMSLNFYSALHPILAVLPSMIAQRRGHIVLVSSMDGKKGLPLDAPYVTAKFALAGLGDVMRQELRAHGVAVTGVFPGRVDTPMIANLRVPWISPKIPPEAVASAIVRAIRNRQREVILPLQARGLHYVSTLSPALGDWIVRAFHLEGWER